MEILRVPALQTNYIFLLHDPLSHQAAVVDPAEPGPVLEILAAQEAHLVAIFNTHHHRDHVGANADLAAHYPELAIYASQRDQGRIPGQTHILREGDAIRFAGRPAVVLELPGHTHGHIAYYFPPAAPGEAGDLFCGDTLFAGGCGRLREGTPAEMLHSLARLRQLPDQTRVWCAHEYTEANLAFALTIEPANADLQARYDQVVATRQHHLPTIPSWLGEEKRTNPFLRWDRPAVQAAVGESEPVAVFAQLRQRKDHF